MGEAKKFKLHLLKILKFFWLRSKIDFRK